MSTKYGPCHRAHSPGHPPTQRWEYRLGPITGTVLAHTRSEARAKVKKLLAGDDAKRMPKGVLLRKLSPEV